MLQAGLFSLLALASVSSGFLSGRVGPTTPKASKRTKICSILDYGASNGAADIGPAIQRAFDSCVKTSNASTLYVPPGNYGMATWVNLNGGKVWAFQMDGVITRGNNMNGGNMIAINDANDFEMWSSNSVGTMQGKGYECRNTGPRLLRVSRSTNFAVHDLILVDAPVFHFVADTGTNAEIYNLAIRGADIGGSDGIDIWGSNIWVHDVMVTNRDECVCSKSPAKNFLVERIWCNQSGGSAIGSLSTGTTVQDITYRNIYTNGGNQIFMIKSNGGSGYVKNVLLENFIARGTAYGLNVDQYWSGQRVGTGDGVQLSNITFSNWNGNVMNGTQRAPIQFFCADAAPCVDMKLNNVSVWSQTDAALVKCRSAYGTGVCLKSGTPVKYAEERHTLTRPAGYTVPKTMEGDLASGFPQTKAIPAPTAIPTSFFPGLPQISPLAKDSPL